MHPTPSVERRADENALFKSVDKAQEQTTRRDVRTPVVLSGANAWRMSSLPNFLLSQAPSSARGRAADARGEMQASTWEMSHL